eukprot:COSAG01_NODE_3553_length_5934_cov_4.175282_1_plen_257_part_00
MYHDPLRHTHVLSSLYIYSILSRSTSACPIVYPRGAAGPRAPPAATLTPMRKAGSFETVDGRLLHPPHHVPPISHVALPKMSPPLKRDGGELALSLEPRAAEAVAPHQSVTQPLPSAAAVAAVRAIRAALAAGRRPFPVDLADYAYTSAGRLPSPGRYPIWPLDSKPEPCKSCVWMTLVMLLLVPLAAVCFLLLVPLMLIFQCVGCCLARRPPPGLADGIHQVNGGTSSAVSVRCYQCGAINAVQHIDVLCRRADG